jgi:hypothetical protein
MTRKTTILPIAVMAVLINSPLKAQVYTLNAIGYVNFNTPPGYSLLTAPILEENPSNGVFNAVADIFSGVQNGISVFTMDGSGFKANNYLNGWTEPEMTLLPGTAWFFKNPYVLQDPTMTITGTVVDGTNGTNMVFSFASYSNQYYLVWTSPALTITNWIPSSFFVATGSPIQASLPVNNGMPEQFFWVEAVNFPE